MLTLIKIHVTYTHFKEDISFSGRNAIQSNNYFCLIQEAFINASANLISAEIQELIAS